MNTQAGTQRTAVIYAFPVGGRSGRGQPRFLAEKAEQTPPVIWDSWYHEAAIVDAEATHKA